MPRLSDAECVSGLPDLSRLRTAANEERAKVSRNSASDANAVIRCDAHLPMAKLAWVGLGDADEVWQHNEPESLFLILALTVLWARTLPANRALVGLSTKGRTMIKLAALGALGYAGYKYYQNNADKFSRRTASTAPNAVAGGPLSDKATLQTAAN